MSSSFFPLSGNVNQEPRYKSTAYAEGVLYDPITKVGILGATGKLTLYRDGVVIFTDRAMTKATDQPDGWVRCAISDTELATHGLYQWRMVLSSPLNTVVLNDSGTFSI